MSEDLKMSSGSTMFEQHLGQWSSTKFGALSQDVNNNINKGPLFVFIKIQ